VKIAELPDCPSWLAEARTENADVDLQEGAIDWYGGDWYGGQWCGGQWCDGVWHGGDWCGGQWCGGQWYGGIWRDGDWCGGVWHGGDWCDEKTDRLLFMAATCGILFVPGGLAVAYRTTQADGHGRHTKQFLQVEGEYRETDLPPAGSGTCVRGIHVSTAARAHTLLGVDRTAQMWEVTFRREDLLDCDGEKARIAGGFFRRIARPF
jgi:hypothetical protein